jgi:hypothetical protein
MKEQTAIQQLIEKMGKSPLMFASALILIDSLKCVEKEKEQIIEAFEIGCKFYIPYLDEQKEAADNYYSRKYQNE